MGVVLVAACCALLPAQAGVDFNIGVTPHGTALSVGYHSQPAPGPQAYYGGRGYCHPPRYVRPCPPVMRCPPPRGHYVTRVERYWVDGGWSESISRYGRVVRVWNPGYWAERTVRVWVNR